MFLLNEIKKEKVYLSESLAFLKKFVRFHEIYIKIMIDTPEEKNCP